MFWHLEARAPSASRRVRRVLYASRAPLRPRRGSWAPTGLSPSALGAAPVHPLLRRSGQPRRAAIAPLLAVRPGCAAMRKQLYVWDFDETVLRIHAYGLQLTVADACSRALDADCADCEFFRAFVAAVLARGDDVAIASFGRYEVIQAYMDRICPGTFTRHMISTPSCVGVPDGCAVPGGKTPQLDALLASRLLAGDAAALPEHRDRVLFLDDSKANVQLAHAAGYTRAYCVPRGGFTREVWAGIVRDAGELPLVDLAALPGR